MSLLQSRSYGGGNKSLTGITVASVPSYPSSGVATATYSDGTSSNYNYTVTINTSSPSSTQDVSITSNAPGVFEVSYIDLSRSGLNSYIYSYYFHYTENEITKDAGMLLYYSKNDPAVNMEQLSATWDDDNRPIYIIRVTFSSGEYNDYNLEEFNYDFIDGDLYNGGVIIIHADDNEFFVELTPPN